MIPHNIGSRSTPWFLSARWHANFSEFGSKCGQLLEFWVPNMLLSFFLLILKLNKLQPKNLKMYAKSGFGTHWFGEIQNYERKKCDFSKNVKICIWKFNKIFVVNFYEQIWTSNFLNFYFFKKICLYTHCSSFNKTLFTKIKFYMNFGNFLLNLVQLQIW